MPFRLTETDSHMLACIADHRILTVGQLAETLQKSRHAIRRRLRDLEREKFLEVLGQEYGRGRGRPENALGLTGQGADMLRDKGLIEKTVPNEEVVGETILCRNHQLLMNWFRIRLAQVERVLPRLSVTFLTHNGPCLPQGPDRPLSINDYAPVPSRGIQEIKFTPDAVIATHDSTESKTCLFFLEVDLGTETMASTRRDRGDIRQKIVNYQWYFRSLRYKRYEKVFNCSLRGFRLLFLTHSKGRFSALCNIVREMPPSGFVWLTDCHRLFADGASAAIWARGGDLHGQPQSILGSLARRTLLDHRDNPRLDSVSS